MDLILNEMKRFLVGRRAKIVSLYYFTPILKAATNYHLLQLTFVRDHNASAM